MHGSRYDSSASQLGVTQLDDVMSIDARDGWLYALHGGNSVSRIELVDGVPKTDATWTV